jgi:hypothetical protein
VVIGILAREYVINENKSISLHELKSNPWAVMIFNQVGEI